MKHPLYARFRGITFLTSSQVYKVTLGTALLISFWVTGEVISWPPVEGVHLIQADLNSRSWCTSHLVLVLSSVFPLVLFIFVVLGLCAWSCTLAKSSCVCRCWVAQCQPSLMGFIDLDWWNCKGVSLPWPSALSLNWNQLRIFTKCVYHPRLLCVWVPLTLAIV